MIGEQGQFWWLSGPNSIFTLFFKIIKKKDYFYKWLLPPMQLACLWVVGNELQIRALWKSLLVKSRQIVFWWWWWWWGCCCCWHSLLKTQHVPGICPKWFMTVKPWERQTECVCAWVCMHLAVSNYLRPHGREPTRLLCPWDFPGKNTGVGSHFLLHGIFPTQGQNPPLLHWQVDSLPVVQPGIT